MAWTFAHPWHHENFWPRGALVRLLIAVPLGFLIYWYEARATRLALEQSRNVTDELVAKAARKSQRCRKCPAIILPGYLNCPKCRANTRASLWAMAAVILAVVGVAVYIVVSKG